MKPRNKDRKHPARKPGAGIHKPRKGKGSYKRKQKEQNDE